MGRHQEALAVLRRAAKMNGTTLPPTDHLLAVMKKVQEQVSEAQARARWREDGEGVQGGKGEKEGR